MTRTAIIIGLACTTASAQEPDFAPVQALVRQYCFDCHSTKVKKADLDLERFTKAEHVAGDVKPWQQLIDQLEAREMPPKGKPQPTDAERKLMMDWTRSTLDAAARSRRGDPGHVPLRRLSNAEYDRTVRDLTGVDLRPAREFPADGAAGEGFTNAAEGLGEISPALLSKYLNAAKSIAEHAVLLPDGVRFSAGATRRDWSNESLERIREFYRQTTPDGRLPLRPYLAATIKHRAALTAKSLTINDAARLEKLNAKYLALLWQTLSEQSTSEPLEAVRAVWRSADVEAVAVKIESLQNQLWTLVPIGSGHQDRQVRQQPLNPLSLRVPFTLKAPTPREVQGNDAFRRVFPIEICYFRILPNAGGVTLKLYCREDEPLARLFLNDEQRRQLERLWSELRFISRQAAVESDYLPQCVEYAKQDQTKEFIAQLKSFGAPFQKSFDELKRLEATAVPTQMQFVKEFASRAYRRPLSGKESAAFDELYRGFRGKALPHEEALRAVLARVLVAPAFLFRIETAPAGDKAAAVNDWELATRLSYFLWSSVPDAELRTIAAAGELHEPAVLAAQARRMIQNPRARALAVEFGTQWIHVRGFAESNQKNEKLFPSFDANLRRSIDEEAVLFFQDFFQRDRVVTWLLDADATFLNETLAKHYGIPGVVGPQWRRVEGVRQHGRGGLLGLAAIQAAQSGASRTSPILRGNWVVETLLGEKLPRPPKDVPQLPEMEGTDNLTTRQLVEKHVAVAECAVCHKRIDPIGFALERYDPIGRRRDIDLGGHRVETKAKLADGTDFDDLDGLRSYLLVKKKDVIVRLFCRKLAGYALGRAVALSDQSLLDDMVAALEKSDGRIMAAVRTLVTSPQFTSIRGRDFAATEGSR